MNMSQNRIQLDKRKDGSNYSVVCTAPPKEDRTHVVKPKKERKPRENIVTAVKTGNRNGTFAEVETMRHTYD